MSGQKKSHTASSHTRTLRKTCRQISLTRLGRKERHTRTLRKTWNNHIFLAIVGVLMLTNSAHAMDDLNDKISQLELDIGTLEIRHNPETGKMTEQKLAQMRRELLGLKESRVVLQAMLEKSRPLELGQTTVQVPSGTFTITEHLTREMNGTVFRTNNDSIVVKFWNAFSRDGSEINEGDFKREYDITNYVATQNTSQKWGVPTVYGCVNGPWVYDGKIFSAAMVLERTGLQLAEYASWDDSDNFRVPPVIFTKMQKTQLIKDASEAFKEMLNYLHERGVYHLDLAEYSVVLELDDANNLKKLWLAEFHRSRRYESSSLCYPKTYNHDDLSRVILNESAAREKDNEVNIEQFLNCFLQTQEELDTQIRNRRADGELLD